MYANQLECRWIFFRNNRKVMARPRQVAKIFVICKIDDITLSNNIFYGCSRELLVIAINPSLSEIYMDDTKF